MPSGTSHNGSLEEVKVMRIQLRRIYRRANDGQKSAAGFSHHDMRAVMIYQHEKMLPYFRRANNLRIVHRRCLPEAVPA